MDMDRIRLSKIEKTCFRHIGLGLEGLPRGVDDGTYYCAVVRLEALGLVVAQYESGGVVYAVFLSEYGRLYLLEYPSLRNPVRWEVITACCMVVSVVLSIIALFVVCVRF